MNRRKKFEINSVSALSSELDFKWRNSSRWEKILTRNLNQFQSHDRLYNCWCEQFSKASFFLYYFSWRETETTKKRRKNFHQTKVLLDLFFLCSVANENIKWSRSPESNHFLSPSFIWFSWTDDVRTKFQKFSRGQVEKPFSFDEKSEFKFFFALSFVSNGRKNERNRKKSFEKRKLPPIAPDGSPFLFNDRKKEISIFSSALVPNSRCRKLFVDEKPPKPEVEVFRLRLVKKTRHVRVFFQEKCSSSFRISSTTFRWPWSIEKAKGFATTNIFRSVKSISLFQLSDLRKFDDDDDDWTEISDLPAPGAKKNPTKAKTSNKVRFRSEKKNFERFSRFFSKRQTKSITWRKSKENLGGNRRRKICSISIPKSNIFVEFWRRSKTKVTNRFVFILSKFIGKFFSTSSIRSSSFTDSAADFSTSRGERSTNSRNGKRDNFSWVFERTRFILNSENQCSFALRSNRKTVSLCFLDNKQIFIVSALPIRKIELENIFKMYWRI